jgi:hypothetical protein
MDLGLEQAGIEPKRGPPSGWRRALAQLQSRKRPAASGCSSIDASRPAVDSASCVLGKSLPTPAEAVSRCGGTWPLTAPEPDCCRQELARAADAHHAAGTRRVSATRIAPNSGRIVTQIQSGGPRPDSPVRVLYAEPRSLTGRPASPVSGRHVLLVRILATFPRLNSRKKRDLILVLEATTPFT